MIPLAADVGDVDFDTAATWERAPMTRAKQVLNAAGIAYERRGRGWLRIRLGEARGALFRACIGLLAVRKRSDFFVEGPTARARNREGFPMKFPPLA